MRAAAAVKTAAVGGMGLVGAAVVMGAWVL
jgi:hypothetical protein